MAAVSPAASHTEAGICDRSHSVVATLNYNRTLTYVLTAPPYLFTVVCMLINGYIRYVREPRADRRGIAETCLTASSAGSDRRQVRWQHVLGPMVVAVIASELLRTVLPHTQRAELTASLRCRHHRSFNAQHWCSLCVRSTLTLGAPC